MTDARSARSVAAGRGTIVLLAAVLALNQADRGSVGALGPTLEHVFGITHFGLGLLAGAFSVVSAIATVPVGVLTDRVPRVRLLAGSVALWTIAMVVGGFAVSFAMLLISRMFLGFVSATGDTTIVSLTGDLFNRGDRARALGLIQAGEFVGVGAGFLIVGAVVSALSWRWVYWLLGALGLVLAYALTRLPEPARGEADAEEAGSRTDAVVHQVVEQHIEPDPDAVVGDVDELSLPKSMLATLDVKTNRTIIVASTVGYLFSAGITLFAVVFATGQYGISNSTAALLLPIVGVGAVAGLVGGGRAADWLARRGIMSGRIIVAIVGFVVASVAFVPALLTHSLAIALPAITIGAAGMAAPNPPLDAVRLDVVVPQLWGRAQSVRTLARTVAEAAGPIGLGALADHLGGGGVRGVQLTLLLLLPALAANGVLLVFATRTYPRDVAAELVSARRQRRDDDRDTRARP